MTLQLHACRVIVLPSCRSRPGPRPRGPALMPLRPKRKNPAAISRAGVQGGCLPTSRSVCSRHRNAVRDLPREANGRARVVAWSFIRWAALSPGSPPAVHSGLVTLRPPPRAAAARCFAGAATPVSSERMAAPAYRIQQLPPFAVKGMLRPCGVRNETWRYPFIHCSHLV